MEIPAEMHAGALSEWISIECGTLANGDPSIRVVNRPTGMQKL
jgi:hypothetical protein